MRQLKLFVFIIGVTSGYHVSCCSFTYSLDWHLLQVAVTTSRSLLPDCVSFFSVIHHWNTLLLRLSLEVCRGQQVLFSDKFYRGNVGERNKRSPNIDKHLTIVV